jgi:TonB family protein
MPIRVSRRCRAAVGYAALWLAVAIRGDCQALTPQISIKRIVAMEYPPPARAARIQGSVLLAGTISSEGGVTNVRLISGNGLLAISARETLSRWRFAGCEDREKGCEIKITFTFILSGTCVLGSGCRTEFAVDLPDAVEVRSGVWDRPMVERSER